MILPTADSGSVAQPVVITGPTNGKAAVLNRGNLANTTDVFNVNGASNITIENLTIENAYHGIDIANGATAVTLLNDVFMTNGDAAIFVPDSAGVGNLVVSNSTIETTGYIYYGYAIYYGRGNSGVLFSNDQVFNNARTGLYLDGTNQTVTGGGYHDDGGTGLYAATAALIQGVRAYANSNANGSDGIYDAGGTVTASTVFGNRNYGIEATVATNNLVYDQSNASYGAIGVNSSDTATGNTVFGGVNGIFAGSNAVVNNNLIYDISGTAVWYGLSAPTSLDNNTIYGAAYGITGGEYYTGAPIAIEGNLIYQTTTAAIALTGGNDAMLLNNTIYEVQGTGILLTSQPVTASYTEYMRNTTVENNIISVTNAPAITIAPTAETALYSDYNFFNLTGTAAAMVNWEGVNYTTLANWYYAAGQDQHSQTGNPQFVNPNGGNGTLGFNGTPGSTIVVTASSASGFATKGVWTAYSAGGGGDGAKALQTAANSGGSAIFTLTGLTVGAYYQAAVNWPSNFIAGTAAYTVRDSNGVALAEGLLDQYNPASSGITADGVGYTPIGIFVASTGSVTITLTGSNGSVVIADGALVQRVGGNFGTDDNFHLKTTSLAIDAGDPATPYAAEPLPSGGRVNQGYDGDTTAAQVSAAAQTVQVTGPAQFTKLQVGEQVPVTFITSGVVQNQAVLAIHAGGAAVNSPTQGDWAAGFAYQTSGSTFTTNTQFTGVANAPIGLFSSGAVAGDNNVGTALNFALQVADGTYTLRLFFADPSAYNTGLRLMNIVVNGTTLVTKFDVYAHAGASDKATELDLTVTASGGSGIALSLITQNSGWAAFVNAIELDLKPAVVTPPPTANVEVSTDNGTTWSLIATGVTLNRFGEGQFLWTVDRTSNGATAELRVSVGTLKAVSQKLLLANGGNQYYINDGSRTGDQYTTAVGNDANSGKSANAPMASLAALLRAYPIGPGDTIYIDTGTYVATSNAILPASDSGSAAQPVLITGPTNGGTVVINRNNLNAYTDIINDTGASYLTIQDLQMQGAYVGVELNNPATNISLLNDTITGNEIGGVTVYASGTASVAGLVIANSVIHDNTYAGLNLQGGLLSATLSNDLIYNNAGNGIDLYASGGTVTVIGGAVFDNAGAGIGQNMQGTIEGVQVYGNTKDGIDVANSYGNPLVTGNTIYANSGAGISATGGIINNNTIYDQVASSRSALELSSNATATGNTIYGSTTGISANGGELLQGNVVYGSTANGIVLNQYNSSDTVTGNIVFGNQVGISGGNTGLILTNNLIYNNVAAGVSLVSGSGFSIVNNTIFQSVGTAVALSGLSNVTLENNILWVNTGTIISVAPGSTTGYIGAYNLFYQGANTVPASIGVWNGTVAATLAAWRAASGQDVNGSKTGNPNFLNIAGADHILGGPGTLVGTGADDNFALGPNSPAIDAGNAYVAPFIDLLGQARHDDPAITNTGNGYPVFAQSSPGSSVLPSGDTSLNLSASGGATTYTFQNGFTFSLYGVNYTSVIVSSQGYLQFAGPNYSGYDTIGTAGLLANVRIAGFWANFNTYTNAGNGVFVTATSTSVTFRWSGTSNATGAGAVNFAVTLNSDGSFVFNYGTIASNLTPVIGVSAGNGIVYVMSSGNGSTTLSGSAEQKFTPTPGYIYFDIGAFEFQGSSADKTAPTVVSIATPPGTTPLVANNGSTGLAFTSLTVTFSKPMDLVSARSASSYQLLKADQNGNFNTTGAIAIPVVPQFVGGSNTVTLLLPNGYLAPGKYQLTLLGSNALFDQSGNALAGNGTAAGSNFVTVFTIDRTHDQPPVAIAQAVTLQENGSRQIVLVGTDAAGFPLTYSIVGSPTHGGVSAITNGNTLIYTPGTNYFGTDQFTFQVTDPDGGESQAAVSLTVIPQNTAPSATTQTVTVYHDHSVVVLLGGTDAETPLSQLTYTITAQPKLGTLVADTAAGPNAFIYTPFSPPTVPNTILGTDTFSFTVTDNGNPPGGSGVTYAPPKTSAAATVTINITDPAPVGAADSYTTRSNVPLVVTAATGVLANDTEAAGDQIQAVQQTQPSHGKLTVTLGHDGSFTYVPNTGFTGTDSFTYVPISLSGTGAPLTIGAAVTVTITVSAPVAPPPPPPPPPGPPKLGLKLAAQVATPLVLSAPAPVATAQSVTLSQNTSTQIVLAASDPAGSALTYSVATTPAHGTVSAVTNGSTLTYTPVANYVGADQFTFQVSDSSGASSQAVVSLAVQAVHTVAAPAGSADAYTIKANGTLTVPSTTGVLANDTTPAGDHVIALLKTAPAHGTLSTGLKADGSFSYVPAPNFTGVDTFTYVPVSTTASGTILAAGAPVTVTITVTAPPPVASNVMVQFSGTHSGTAKPDRTEDTARLTPPTDSDPTGAALDVGNLITQVAPLSGDAIVLPSFTTPGDETWSLMLPVAAEVAQLPDAVAAAMQRLTTHAPATISFVDPITGHHTDDIDPGAVPHQPWLLIDPDASHPANQPSRIRWDSHPT